MKNAADHIYTVTQKWQFIFSNAHNIILGYFNHCNMKKTLNNFYQYVTCPIRLNKALELCYGSIRGAYKSTARAPLGSSDHNTMHLLPLYRTVLKMEKVQKRDMKFGPMKAIWYCRAVLSAQIGLCFKTSDNIDEVTVQLYLLR